MSIPQRAPNFNSADPDSAWWLYYAGPAPVIADAVVFATTGYFFVRELQAQLLRRTLRTRKAYRSGGPLGGGSLAGVGYGGANTDFGNVVVDGKWGPTTNAALWRLIAEQAVPSLSGDAPSASTFDATTLRYLDAIEQSAKDRRINALTLEAAGWLLVHSEDPNWRQQMLPWARVGIPENMRAAVVPPPWNASPPAAIRPVTGMSVRSWLVADSAPPPLPATDGTPNPSTQQPQGSSSSVVFPVVAGMTAAALLATILYGVSKLSSSDGQRAPERLPEGSDDEYSPAMPPPRPATRRPPPRVARAPQRFAPPPRGRR